MKACFRSSGRRREGVYISVDQFLSGQEHGHGNDKGLKRVCYESLTCITFNACHSAFPVACIIVPSVALSLFVVFRSHDYHMTGVMVHIYISMLKTGTVMA